MNVRINLLLFFLLGFSAAQADEIRMAASDLLAEFITPTLKAFAEENDVDFKIDAIGSLPALDRLRSDELDLAIIAVPEGIEVPRDEFSIYPFAYDAAVIVVNDSNPTDDISLPKLGGIFGTNEELNFNTWGELGLSGWATRNIKPLAGPAEGSVSLELFRFAVLSGGGLKPSVAVLRDNEIEDAIAGNISSIGVLSALPKNKNLKVLMISESDDQNSPAFGPTEDNIHLGDYPLRLSFFIAFNPRDEEKIKEVLRVLLGDDIASALNNNKLFALPDTVRNQLLIDLNFQQQPE